jgi:hypothetical protein
MPKGPRGEKRPADAIGAAIMVAKIATGEIIEDKKLTDGKARERGKLGGKARAEALPKAKRKKIASNAARARWTKVTNPSG